MGNVCIYFIKMSLLPIQYLRLNNIECHALNCNMIFA